MLGASNLRQQRRLWTLLGRPDMIKQSNDERDADHAREIAALEEIMLTRSADEWETFLQANHVPAARVRTMGEAVTDPQLATRGIIHRHASGAGIDGGFGVPLAAFTFAHGGPRIDTPPPTLGQHNDEIFGELRARRALSEIVTSPSRRIFSPAPTIWFPRGRCRRRIAPAWSAAARRLRSRCGGARHRIQAPRAARR